MKIFIDICNAAKIMLLGKGSFLAVGRRRGFISIIKSSAVGVRLNKFLNVYSSLLGGGGGGGGGKVKVHSSSPFQ